MEPNHAWKPMDSRFPYIFYHNRIFKHFHGIIFPN